jgi:hypothetical protein
MSDRPVDGLISPLHEAAMEYRRATGRDEPGNFDALVRAAERARQPDSEGPSTAPADPNLTLVEALQLDRLQGVVARIEREFSEPTNLGQGLRTAFALPGGRDEASGWNPRSAVDRIDPESDAGRFLAAIVPPETEEPRSSTYTLDSGTRIAAARLALAVTAKYSARAPGEPGSSEVRPLAGLRDAGPDVLNPTQSAAEVGPIHLEVMDGAAVFVDRQFGVPFAVTFSKSGQALLENWFTGETVSLGQRAEIALTGGVSLHVASGGAGSPPEVLIVRGEEAFRVAGPDFPLVHHHGSRDIGELLDVQGEPRQRFRLEGLAGEFIPDPPATASGAGDDLAP